MGIEQKIGQFIIVVHQLPHSRRRTECLLNLAKDKIFFPSESVGCAVEPVQLLQTVYSMH